MARRRTSSEADLPRRASGLAHSLPYGSYPVIKPEWGTKRQCPKCATRFYDLTHDNPITCIGCGHSWIAEPILKSKQTLPFEAAKAQAGAVEAEPALEADDLDLDAEADGEPAEDNDVDIGGDDDLSEVVVEDREEDR